ncbi:MAG: hypothetical protein H6713_36950 [Myxococcales bacterium]|nr:hypothetical protein [Myxococcales bacterium]
MTTARDDELVGPLSSAGLLAATRTEAESIEASHTLVVVQLSVTAGSSRWSPGCSPR